ncbi:glycerophosphodiester phosphodiesterase domain-containing protein 4 [Eptesicus fuscus]|uniref:glycerophosphodiester phosphodiesterase domain-containing protein 4 n=1 Tax=Eptesicus fuscus TaxID=29078 RepID=UPI0024045EA1|nr:glycerophosphodiester phosphodiesterase domain-containing protein 4 [Eptesicus fuscus]
MSVLLLFMWIETSNEYNGFDWVVYLLTGYWYFWSILLLSLFGILVVYISLLLILGVLLIREGYEPYLYWCHKILVMLAILICTFFLSVLCIYWNDRWLTLGLSLKVFAPHVHLTMITVMVLLSWPVAFYLIHLEQEARFRRDQSKRHKIKRIKTCARLTKLRAAQVVIGLPFFLILLFLFVVPWGFYSPCVENENKLGPKPGLFGHRGAPMLAPENTMMSFEKAVENEAFGLETDVFLSIDEVPFLMHDHNLRRTTDIREVRPNESYSPSSFFYWNFLSTLNAGKWFVDSWKRPFYNMKPLSKADKEKAKNQRIPKLSDYLEIARKTNKYVIFDLNGPPPKHPLRNTYVRRVVDVILDSKIEQRMVYWLPGFDRGYVRWKAPNFQHVGRLDPIYELKKENISIINVDYKRLFHNGLSDYKAANIIINLYIVNEPWIFSLAWCSRINSVTTDNIVLLREINYPYYSMTPKYYVFLWVLLDCISAVFIFAIFYFHWWRESLREQVFERTSSYTDTGSRRSKRRKSEKIQDYTVTMPPPSQVGESPEPPAAPPEV